LTSKHSSENAVNGMLIVGLGFYATRRTCCTKQLVENLAACTAELKKKSYE